MHQSEMLFGLGKRNMLLEPGGYAEKLGNRYEGRWVVRQVLHLLNGEIRPITVEAIGDDEAGVDLWIERKDGVREAQQCKIGNSANPDWSMAALNQRRILQYLRRQLERDRSYQFALISSVPAVTLQALSLSARDSTGDPQDFYAHQVKRRSPKLKTAFSDFCRYLELGPEQPNDIASAFDILQRSDFHLFSDDQKTRDDMRAWAGYLVDGEPVTTIAAIADYVEQNLRKPIYADTIRAHLAGLGLHPRQLPHDNRVAPAIESLQTQFKTSIGPGLIGGLLLPREETASVLKAVDEHATTGVILLHGAAGAGKSGVLYELSLRLREREIPFLPIRLDRKVPRNNTIQFGKDMGLPESPARCLEALAAQRPSVLILDQLDALRWTSSHSANALEVCKSLVNEVLAARDSGQKMTVVLACRTFDFKHDPGIKEWLHDGRGQNHVRYTLAP